MASASKAIRVFLICISKPPDFTKRYRKHGRQHKVPLPRAASLPETKNS